MLFMGQFQTCSYSFVGEAIEADALSETLKIERDPKAIRASYKIAGCATRV